MKQLSIVGQAARRPPWAAGFETVLHG